MKTAETRPVVVDHAELRNLVASLFRNSGLPDSDAELVADVLVTADLRGVTSHGVSNLPTQYLSWLRAGKVNPKPEWKLTRERGSTATVDADRGLGVVVAPRAMEIAIEKARATGIGMVAIGNGRHLGMAAFHAMIALRDDMIGICMTAVGPRVVPTWGREPRLGTNPIAFAAPAGSTPDFVYDASTAVVAHGKLRLAHEQGIEVSGGLFGDVSGSPVLEPSIPPADLTMLPLGSTSETSSHKGYGLGAMVEVMCSVLSGGSCMALVGHGSARHLVAAIDVDAFTDVGTFKASMDEFHRTLTDTAPAPGRDRVVVAGQLEWETEQERRREGIPLAPQARSKLAAECRQAGIDTPTWLRNV